MNNTIFKNENVEVTKGEKDICFYDLTDRFNDTKGFTRNIRGLDKAAQFIENLSKDMKLSKELRFSGVVGILDGFNLKPHTYCGMD